MGGECIGFGSFGGEKEADATETLTQRGKRRMGKQIKKCMSQTRHSDGYISSAHYKYFLTESTLLFLRRAQKLIPYALISEPLLETRGFSKL